MTRNNEANPSPFEDDDPDKEDLNWDHNFEDNEEVDSEIDEDEEWWEDEDD